jgi:hypothetical protein
MDKEVVQTGELGLLLGAVKRQSVISCLPMISCHTKGLVFNSEWLHVHMQPKRRIYLNVLTRLHLYNDAQNVFTKLKSMPLRAAWLSNGTSKSIIWRINFMGFSHGKFVFQKVFIHLAGKFVAGNK